MCKHMFLGFVTLLTFTQCLKAGETPRLDLYGDPLPAGAVARLGTVRWRHENRIETMSYSPDGKYLACSGAATPGSHYSSISILDARNGRRIRRLLGHGLNVFAVAFSPSGRLLASCGADDRIRLWDMADGTLLWSYHWPLDKTLVKPGIAGLLTRPTTSTLTVGNYREAAVSRLQFSHDGKHLFLKGWALPTTPSGSGNLVGVLEVATGKRGGNATSDSVGSLRRFAGWGFQFLADGETMAVALPGDIVQLRDVMTGQVRAQVKFSLPDISTTSENRQQGRHLLRYLWASPDRKTLLLGTGQRLVSIDVASGKVITTLAQREGGSDPVQGEVVFSPDGKRMALLLDRDDREIRIADARTGQTLSNSSFSVYSTWRPHAAFSADGKRLAVAVVRTIRLWDVESGDEIPTSAGHRDVIDAVALSPNGALAATASRDKTVRLWQTQPGRELHRWSLGRYGVQPCESRVAFAPDGKLLAVTKKGQIDLVACSDGKTQRSLKGYLTGKKTNRDRWECALAFSDDGKELVSVRTDQWPDHESVWQRWEVASGKILDEKHFDIGDQKGPEFVTPGMEWFEALPLSPDSTRFASLDFASQAMFFWEARTGKQLFRVNSPKGFTTARFSPDGKLVALGVQSGSLYLLDSQKGTTVRKISGPAGHSFPRAFLDEGRVLLSDHQDNSTRLWDVDSGEQLYRVEGHRIRACSVDGRYAASVSEDHVLLIWDLVALRGRLEAAGDREAQRSLAAVRGKLPAALSGRRKWTDSTGKYTVVAKLVELQKDAVRLRKETGSVVTVPVARLSEADRKLLRRATAQRPAAPEPKVGSLPSDPPEIELVTDAVSTKRETLTAPALPLPKGAFLLLTFDRGTFIQEGNQMFVFDLAHRINGFGGVGVGFSPQGKVAGGLSSLDGGIAIPKPSLNKRSEYTLTMWARSNRSGDLYVERSATKKAGFALGIGDDRYIYIGARNKQKPGDTWMVAQTPANSVPMGEWFFLAVRLKDGKAGNGKLKVTINDRSFDLNLQGVNIDNAAHAELRGTTFGLIDEVAFFGRALSDEEIKTVRQMGLNGQPLSNRRPPLKSLDVRPGVLSGGRSPKAAGGNK